MQNTEVEDESTRFMECFQMEHEYLNIASFVF